MPATGEVCVVNVSAQILASDDPVKYLPALAHRLQKSGQIQPYEGVSMGGKGGTILIVDDDQDTRDGLMMLLREDHECFAAGTAEEAMRLLGAKAFDLLLTDIHMPGASGLELCRLAHKLSPDTVVIVVSGMKDIRYQIEAMRQGTLYFMEKPVDLARLSALVESALKCQSLGAAKHRDRVDQSVMRP